MKLKSVTQFGLCGISHYLVLIFILFTWEDHKKTSAADCDSAGQDVVYTCNRKESFPQRLCVTQREKTADRWDEEMSDRNVTAEQFLFCLMNGSHSTPAAS